MGIPGAGEGDTGGGGRAGVAGGGGDCTTIGGGGDWNTAGGGGDGDGSVVGFGGGGRGVVVGVVGGVVPLQGTPITCGTRRQRLAVLVRYYADGFQEEQKAPIPSRINR